MVVNRCFRGTHADSCGRCLQKTLQQYTLTAWRVRPAGTPAVHADSRGSHLQQAPQQYPLIAVEGASSKDLHGQISLAEYSPGSCMCLPYCLFLMNFTSCGRCLLLLPLVLGTALAWVLPFRLFAPPCLQVAVAVENYKAQVDAAEQVRRVCECCHLR